MALPVIINLKTMDSLKKGYEVLDSQYLLANNDSPKIIKVKFKQWSTIRIWIGNTLEISYSSYRIRLFRELI